MILLAAVFGLVALLYAAVGFGGLPAVGKHLKDFPRSSKAPDALFKMGLAYERLGEAQQARQAFDAVVSIYPKSAMVDLARTHLGAGAPTGGSR